MTCFTQTYNRLPHCLKNSGTSEQLLLPQQHEAVPAATPPTVRREQLIHAAKTALFYLCITFACLFGLLLLYLIKSALGIDLIPGFSLGIWGWFKAHVFFNSVGVIPL